MFGRSGTAPTTSSSNASAADTNAESMLKAAQLSTNLCSWVRSPATGGS